MNWRRTAGARLASPRTTSPRLRGGGARSDGRDEPGGSGNNQRYLTEHVTWGEGIKPEEQVVLCDAQTSGGLLIAVPPRRRSRLMAALRKRGVMAAEIG